MSEHLLSIDLGTTHCRVAVHDSGGACLGSASRRTPVLAGPGGAAEQDAEQVWETARDLMRQVAAETGANDLLALAVSAQGDAIIPIDRNGKALHNAILGMDYRALAQSTAVERRFGGRRIFRLTGMRPHPLNALCKLLWLKEERRAVFESARRIMTFSDFLAFRLGADPGIDVTMASRTMGFDLARGTWSGRMLSQLGIDPALLSPVVPSGAPLGRMSRGVSESLGLSARPMIVAGAHDQVCAALGAGVPVRCRSVISTGTAEVLSCAFDTPVLNRAMYDAFYPCSRFAGPGMFFTFSLNHTGGILLDWFLGLLDEGRPPSYDRVFSDLPEGPSPVLVLPHFNGSGTPWCDTRSLGAMLGLTLTTDRRDIALALLESLSFELRINLERMEAAGIAVGQPAAVGGGAKSRAWLQIKADILERPVSAPATPDAASLGAAILAGAGSGLFSTIAEGIGRLVPAAVTVEPRPATSARYRERYSIYRGVYPRLTPIHRRLGAP